jgi:hypothetical protein
MIAMALERPSRSVLLALALFAVAPTSAATITVDCNTGAAIGPAIGKLKPGDVLLVQGTCRENVLIHSEINGVTVDGQARPLSPLSMHASPRSRFLAAKSPSRVSR